MAGVCVFLGVQGGGLRVVGLFLVARACFLAGGGVSCCWVRGRVRWASAGDFVGGGKGGANDAECGWCGGPTLVFAHGDVQAWSCASLVSWSLPSDATAARISQMRVRTWCTSWLVVGGAYFKGWLTPPSQTILLMERQPQVRCCCGLRGSVVLFFEACFDF